MMNIFEEATHKPGYLMFLEDVSESLQKLGSKHKNFQDIVAEIEQHLGKNIEKTIKQKNKSLKQ